MHAAASPAAAFASVLGSSCHFQLISSTCARNFEAFNSYVLFLSVHCTDLYEYDSFGISRTVDNLVVFFFFFQLLGDFCLVVGFFL